ncbi:Oxygen-independent coproporphyrinogen III oxidase [Ascidiaceihabitans donghaensis]|uniref:Coproporphyrinogen-III oxidase n=2 Tax=Ascidiaceihabitans donghaensis TaxID=1510460 RepID=A0A2R8BA42_9RHOB|nr:Oxygen-independent coproporphyrinogen III oxidase [Ascidiaceihabitans donghaensis]
MLICVKVEELAKVYPSRMEKRTEFSKLGLFDAHVPRYTSYPTAPHFSGDVGPDTFSHWVQAVPENGQVSLYLHIPFCRRLCWFCACRTQGTQSGAPVRGYLDTLKVEIDMLAAQLAPGITLSRMHWGGGTPTLLTSEMITELADHVAAVLPFGPNAEFSVEIDPGEIDQPRVDALAAAGMTRGSIGVQDFDPAIQKTIGRIQSYETTARAVDMLRAVGVTSLNTDILFGLPGQDREKITQSVQKLLSLGPDRVALYGYAHVPWMARRQTMIPTDLLPKPEERLRLFETAARLFEWDGYDAIGIDHFARKDDGLAIARRNGTLRRNFQGYTDDTSDTLIGLGASSISKFPQGYAQNAPVTSAYAGLVRGGGMATVKGHALTQEDLLRGRLIERLMCDFKASAAQFPGHEDHVSSILRKVANAFEGAVKFDGNTLKIPADAAPLTRLIARAVDAYHMDRKGHASAI